VANCFPSHRFKVAPRERGQERPLLQRERSERIIAAAGEGNEGRLTGQVPVRMAIAETLVRAT